MSKLLSIFQSAGSLIEAKGLASNLAYPIEQYNMLSSQQSTFIDIGSGFGKPVFHSAIQTGCMSYGVEVVQARVAFSVDRKFIFCEEIEKARQKREKSSKTVDTSKPPSSPLKIETQ